MSWNNVSISIIQYKPGSNAAVKSFGMSVDSNGKEIFLREVDNAIFKSVWGRDIKTGVWGDEASSQG